jgi:hypothetical protein
MELGSTDDGTCDSGRRAIEVATPSRWGRGRDNGDGRCWLGHSTLCRWMTRPVRTLHALQVDEDACPVGLGEKEDGD